MSQLVHIECEIAFLERSPIQIEGRILIPTRIQYVAEINRQGSFSLAATIVGKGGELVVLPSSVSHPYPKMPPWFASTAKQIRETSTDVRNRN